MSPEQARGLEVDRRTDIWAFGCILYEMLAGRPVFAGATGSDIIAAVLTTDVDLAALPPDTPASLRALVVRCLERSTKARLRDIADARPHLDAGPEIVAPTGPRSGLSRRSALVTGSAALGLLAVGGAGGGALVARRAAVPATVPSYQRLTFRRGMIRTARFGPDFKTVYYGALWDGDVCRVHSVRPESPESTAMSLPPAAPLAVSSAGALALALGTHQRGIMTYGTLARVPITGGAPRQLQEHVKYADWSPDGQALAIVRRAGEGDQLEFPAGTVISRPDTPSGGFGFPRISPRGDAVAVFELASASGLEGRVVIVDRAGTRRATSATYFNVFGLAWKEEEVWFTAADDLPLSRNAIHAMNASGVVRIVARVPATRVCTISPLTAERSSREPTIAAGSPCRYLATRPLATFRGSMRPCSAISPKMADRFSSASPASVAGPADRSTSAAPMGRSRSAWVTGERGPCRLTADGRSPRPTHRISM